MRGSVPGLAREDSPGTGSGSRLSQRSTSFAWRAASWFGVLFLIIGAADMALVWYPLRPGNPSWEFGAVDLSFSSLPVLTIGFAMVVVSALALGRKRLAMFLGGLSLLIGLLCLGGYLLFLSDVPLALRNSPPEVLTGIKKAVFRNSVFGVTFATAYLAAGVAVLRHTRAT